MSFPNPPQSLRLTDDNGRLTPDGWMWLLSLINYMRELEARIAALEP